MDTIESGVVASAEVEAMKDDIEEVGASHREKIAAWLGQHITVPARYKLVSDEDARKKSIWSVRFVVVASAINTKMLNPNYPIMVTPDLHPDSFPDTDPFDFNSATYFIPMCSLLGVAIASIFVGQISDRVGRKRVLLLMAVVSTCGSVLKYLLRQRFWPFCIVNFCLGFFLGNLPIGMAYIGDIFTSKKQKESELGVLVGGFVMGNSGGGMIAILMEASGLFTPLLVGSGIMFLASLTTLWYMIEPGDARLVPMGKDYDADVEEEEQEELKRAETLDQRTMWNVVAGALADNIGSTSLFPLCLSPLALEQYFADFEAVGEDPIMSLNGYKWLSVCVALMVVPSTVITPYIFDRIGVAATCVVGNVCTGFLTMGLLFIGTGPATTAYFAGFVTLMYGGFPFTVFSQLTTGPMLDILAPENKIGYVQGLNNSAMNFGMAFAPWLLGLLADGAGTSTAIWTGIGISFFAGVLNAPLMFHKGYGPTKKKAPVARRPLPKEDADLVEKVLRGEIVPPEDLFELNRERLYHRKAQLVPKVTPYTEDKDSLGDLQRHAQSNFAFRSEMHDRFLAGLADPKSEITDEEFCNLLNAAASGSESEISKEAKDDLGDWITDYLGDVGYSPHLNSLLIKQMILSAFPVITRDKEFTPENVTEALARSRQVMNEYASVPDKRKYSPMKTLGNGGAPVYYS